MTKYRIDYRKNIVYCGFNEVEKRSIVLYPAPGPTYHEDEKTPYRKAPVNIVVDTLKEAMKHRGLALYLKVDKDINFVEFDKKYRKKLDYWFIRLYHEDFQYQDNKFSNISLIDEREMFSDYDEKAIDYIDTYFKTHKPFKIHLKRKETLDTIHHYMQKHKEATSQELVDTFNINMRNIQRYMNDINRLYHDIGYDYSKNNWYICE